MFYTGGPSTGPLTGATAVAIIPYAELHAHTNFSFLDGASPSDDLVERAVAQGLTGLAVTDRNGLYGAVRFMGAAEEAGLHGIVGTEIEVGDPEGVSWTNRKPSWTVTSTSAWKPAFSV